MIIRLNNKIEGHSHGTVKPYYGYRSDYNNLNNDRFSSNTIEAIKYRRAYARANNAIEGVVLSETDRRFMDSIPVGMSKTDFTKAVLNHLRSKRH